ncbi:MAG: hypothetical protein ACRCS8_05640 [Brevinema sp.]
MLSSKIKELKEKGHIILSISFNANTFLFKKPTLIEIAYHQDQVYQSDTIFRLREKFLRQMFVGENTTDFDNFMTSKPLAHAHLYDLICQDLGDEINFTMAKV